MRRRCSASRRGRSATSRKNALRRRISVELDEVRGARVVARRVEPDGVGVVRVGEAELARAGVHQRDEALLRAADAHRERRRRRRWRWPAAGRAAGRRWSGARPARGPIVDSAGRRGSGRRSARRDSAARSSASSAVIELRRRGDRSAAGRRCGRRRRRRSPAGRGSPRARGSRRRGRRRGAGEREDEPGHRGGGNRPAGGGRGHGPSLMVSPV